MQAVSAPSVSPQTVAEAEPPALPERVPEVVRPELALVKEPQAARIETEQPVQAEDALNWSQLAYELDLDALAGQVVINCVVKSWQDNQLTLAYLPELELMIKPEIKEQIKRAIESRLGLELKLEFIAQERLNAETPQQARIRLLDEERQSAIAAIKQDPVVQKLNSLFGARLIENSVKKVKE